MNIFKKKLISFQKTEVFDEERLKELKEELKDLKERYLASEEGSEEQEELLVCIDATKKKIKNTTKKVDVEIKPKELVDMLDSELAHSAAVLKTLDPESEDYDKVVKNLKAVNDVKEQLENKVNKGVWVTAGASILGVVLLIAGEKAGLIFNSKAMGFVPKVKV